MSIAVQAPAQAPSSSPSRDLIVGEPGSPVASGADPRFAQYKVIRRNGAVVGFEPAKISIAMTKAFLAINGGQGAASARVRSVFDFLAQRQGHQAGVELDNAHEST